MLEKIGILVTLLRGLGSTPTKLAIKIEIPQIEFLDLKKELIVFGYI